MSGRRVVLLGATGYTGRLVAQALVDRGVRPVLAGRDATALRRLTTLLGLEGLVTDAAAIGTHLRAGDALVSCAGPFAQTGAVVLEAALRSRAHLVDCSGEADYLRAAVAAHGEAAEAGVTVLPGFGFDYVPGHVAATAALHAGGGHSVRVVYLLAGAHGASRGSRASLSPGGAYVRRAGALEVEPEPRWVDQELDERPCCATVIGSTEALLLHRTEPGLQDVEVALGRIRDPVRPRPVRRPAVESGIDAGDLGGPPAEQRARSASIVGAWAGSAHVVVEGPDGYELTAELLAAAAERLAHDPPATGGVRGPVEFFGRDGAPSVLAQAGMTLSVREGAAT